jgi:serine/threonine protein kinase
MEVGSTSEARSFGKYTLVAKLAMGGMAEIFLARLNGDGGFSKLVCIKRILPHLAKDPQFVAMFLDEARVAARISHPNVCHVFELGEYGGQYYIAMEYLQGVPLSCFRRTDFYPGLTDPRLVAAFGIQACEGLHHAHQLKRPDGEQLGVVHRDVSPGNLFVTVDGIIKVLDFGIAKVQDASSKTSTGAVKGTYAYMAPEQIRGDKIDRRVDVFAMGVVLWETLAQRHLFKRDNDFLTFQAIINEPVQDIQELRHDVPPLLGDTIMRAIAQKPDDRFPSARALGEALLQAVAPLGGPLPPSEIGEEVAASFTEILEEQYMLVRLAQEGGQLDLADESELVGHGTQLGTTPVSNLQRRPGDPPLDIAQHAQNVIASLEAERTPQPRPGAKVPTARDLPIEPYSQPYALAPREWRSQEMEAVQPVPMRPSQPVRVVKQSSRLPWIIAIAALLVAAGSAAMLFLGPWKPRAAQVPVAAAPVQDAAVVAQVTPDAAVANVTVVAADAGIASDAQVAAMTRDAGETTVARVTGPRGGGEKHTQVVKAPSGPPGFITIDSAPVYAVIYIDGKKYGETPLVNLKLPPGKHAVKAVSPSGATRALSITIESGKTAPVRRIEW